MRVRFEFEEPDKDWTHETADYELPSPPRVGERVSLVGRLYKVVDVQWVLISYGMQGVYVKLEKETA